MAIKRINKAKLIPLLPNIWLSPYLSLILMFFLVFLASCNTSAEENYVDAKGYVYKFETVETPGIGEGSFFAIDTFAPKSEVLRSRIPNVPPQSCSNDIFKTPKELTTKAGKKYIVFCRNDLERSQTIYIMSYGRLDTKIEFDSSTPNLVWDEKLNAFVAKTYPRLLDTLGSLSWFFVIYVWNPESHIDISAHATFSEATSHYYQEFYNKTKKEIANNPAIGKYLLAPLVAALVSTSSLETICKEIDVPPLSTLKTEQLNKHLSFVTNYGFPDFNLKQCNRRH